MTYIGGIGHVHRDWRTERARWLFQKMSRKPRDEDGIVTAFRDGQVTLRENRRTDGFTFADKEIGYQGVRRGDLVVHAMDAFAGAIGVSESDGKCSPVYAVLLPCPGTDARYYAYLVRNLATSGFVASLARGIRERSTDFRYATFRELELPVPPLDVQRAIADFLDRKTAALDALIDKKERLLALLQEKRQALITQAVTKGLDPNVPKKDSGIEWLGEIPAHWEILQLRRVVERFVDYRGRTPTKVDDGVPLVTAGAVRDGVIDHSRAPEFIPPDELEELLRRGKPALGDLVITTEAPLGEVGIVDRLGVGYAQRIILMKMNPGLMTSDFLRLFYLSLAGVGELHSRASGSTASGIRADRLRGSAVPVPPLREQRAISSEVARKLAPDQAVAEGLTTSIERLREYRQALITAAVTGQLDVTAQHA